MPHVHVSFSYTFFLSFAYGHYDNPYAYIWAVLEGRYVCCMVLILHRRKSIFILIRHINDILFEGGVLSLILTFFPTI